MESKDKDIRYLKGVGEKKARLFAKKGIKSVGDLLYFFPKDHEDRTVTKTIDEAVPGETCCIRARVFSDVRERRIRRGMTLYTLVVADGTGNMNITWFNNRFVKDAFKRDTDYVFYGKISDSRYKKEMTAPIWEEAENQRYTGRIVPLYPLTEGLTQKTVQSAMENAIETMCPLKEYLPREIRKKYELAEINFAMQKIHFPANDFEYTVARRRWVFEELYTLRIAMLLKKGNDDSQNGAVFRNTDTLSSLEAALPFALTGAQKKVISEIVSDLTSGRRMSRLVQGDVGSGKTAVAAAALYLTAKNGMQAAMMAPTEILARQHYESLFGLLSPFGINVGLLLGSMSAAEKRLMYDSIEMGLTDIVVGTHALIQDKVRFRELGLVVADEQHRFGVEQRAKLLAKGADPHMLVMSATPIPRTLALILYGDLDVSVIDELPPGRKAVRTFAVGENMRRRVYAFMQKNVEAGMQCYVVCPMVEETETMDLKNATGLAEQLGTIFPQFKVGLVHGKMKPKLKDEVMTDFLEGKLQILVTTTVIEVGVNVPNSNMMIIENAERFGLSQLHQLRGRVGRGGDQAYCILFAHGNNDITKKRMEIITKSNDGFYISEQDLKLRGPGDFFGTRQHGLPEMKIANLFEDSAILEDAQNAARETVDGGKLSDPEYAELKRRIDLVFDSEMTLN